MKRNLHSGIGNRKSVFKETTIPVVETFSINPLECSKGQTTRLSLKTMDQCIHEVRAEYWRKIIQACSQRPAGQSAKNWMDENGINEQSYYHWQRRFRQQAYEEMKENTSVPAPFIFYMPVSGLISGRF